MRTDPAIFEFLQEGSLDGIWYWDIQNPHEEWLSPRFKEVFGYAEDEIPSTSDWWQANIFPEDLPIAVETFEAHCADPTHAYDQIVRYRHKDGSTVWVRCRGIAIRDDTGNPTRMLGAHTDLTELMETRAALESAMPQGQGVLDPTTKRVLDLLPNIIWTADMHGEVTWINRWWEENVTGEAWTPRWYERVHPDDAEEAASRWANAIADKGKSRYEG